MAINDEQLMRVDQLANNYDLPFDKVMACMNKMAHEINDLWQGDPLDGDECADVAEAFRYFLLIWNGNE